MFVLFLAKEHPCAGNFTSPFHRTLSLVLNEPCHEKTGFLLMQKQRHRSASQLPALQ